MRRIAAIAAALAALAAAGTARADGLPVLGVDVGGKGVVAPGGGRYVTIPAGRDTLVARVGPDGRIFRSRLLRGAYTIPAVAYDGSASGLSADGRTLVLIRPRLTFPRARTPLLVLDAPFLRTRARLDLRGDFSFDAISPRGGLVYLIQYVSPTDPTQYLVRGYDLRAGRLLARPVVDPAEPDEDMRGQPLTRATSADGRWAYTLYDGGGEPFVHALDTARATARCIDLDSLAGRDLSALRLELRVAGGSITVHDGLYELAVVDTRTFRVSDPPRPQTDAQTGGTGVPWEPVLLLPAALLGAVALAFRRRRRLVSA
jgi:hypothetical protein